MKSRFLLICSVCLVVLLMGASLVSAQSDATCKYASLFEGWAAASPAGAPNGAAYGFVANFSSEPDTLLSASTDGADMAEVHEMKVGANDVMQMSPVEGGLMIPAQGFQELKQGSYHIMLMNLKKPLVAGESLDLTLTFKNAGEIKVIVPIKDMTQPDMMGGMGGEATMEPMGGSMDAGSTMPMVPEGCAKVHVLGGWVRASGPGMPNSAAYALIVNLTDSEDTLTSVSNTAAASVELHEMKMGAGDVMQMSPVEGGIVIPAGGSAILQPGGFHIMMIGLTGELKEGTTQDFTLTFAKAGEIKVTFPVQAPPAAKTGMSMDATATPSS
jgi:copper(I)-binding protein